MSEASQKFGPMISGDSVSAISSPASECGATPCVSPDGPMTDLFGREVAPVRPLAARGKAEGLMILATSGRLGLDSSASASLQRSLENRLMTRLDTAGSTLFKLTWKGRRTPLGRRYLERAVSVLRTSGKGCTSVPTPDAHPDMPNTGTNRGSNYGGDRRRLTTQGLGPVAKLSGVPTPNTPSGGPNAKSTATHTGGMDLDGVATLADAGILMLGTKFTDSSREKYAEILASVPTPMSGSPATETYNAAGNNDYSRKIVELASTATPKATDAKGNPYEATENRRTELRKQVYLATVATPKSEDSQCAGAHRGSPDTLHSQTQLAASGETANGGTAATASIGPIEPGLFPLAHGATNRVLKLRGYGDAIVPQVAAEFVSAYMEASQ